MSLYSIIGIALLFVTATISTVLKIVLSKRRKQLDGFHGFLQKEEMESSTDEWELL